MTLRVGQFTALAIFVLYFVIIVGLFYLVLASVINQATHHGNFGKAPLAFGVLACISFAHTWHHMIRFLLWSFRAYEAQIQQSVAGSDTLVARLSSWLLETSLFEQAWAAVSFGSLNWWWSQQLCLYTVGAWTIYLATQGRIYHIRHIWAYMLLGQLVAISVASNLFYMSVLLSLDESRRAGLKHKSKLAWVSPALYLPVFISFAAVANSPYTSVVKGTFLPNLLIMHALIVIPLLFPPSDQSWLPSMRHSALAFSLSGISFLLHMRTTSAAFSSLSLNMLIPGDWHTFVVFAWDVLTTHHPAQSSIGWDVVWTTISFLVWSAYGVAQALSLRPVFNILLSSLTPLISVGAAAPLELGFSDGEQISGKREN